MEHYPLGWHFFYYFKPMQNYARFLIEGWFNLTNRGLVITGQITSGKISAGDHIYLDDKLIKIKSVEIGNTTPDTFFIGLILDNVFPNETLLSILNTIKGKTLLILTTGTGNQVITS